MARNTERAGRRSPKDAARRTKKKPCALCRDKVAWVDYKDVPMLRKYMSDRGKIRARRVTGNCAQHQREIALAIKTARELVLLPYTQRTVTERSGGRGRGRGDRPGGPGRHGPPSAPESVPALDAGNGLDAASEVSAATDAATGQAPDAVPANGRSDADDVDDVDGADLAAPSGVGAVPEGA
jgi:small subunit ribosomal protein S18